MLSGVKEEEFEGNVKLGENVGKESKRITSKVESKENRKCTRPRMSGDKHVNWSTRQEKMRKIWYWANIMKGETKKKCYRSPENTHKIFRKQRMRI